VRLITNYRIARRSQEEPGGASRSEPGGARQSQVEPGGARDEEEHKAILKILDKSLKNLEIFLS
jgi:hypothetical protein